MEKFFAFIFSYLPVHFLRRRVVFVLQYLVTWPLSRHLLHIAGVIGTGLVFVFSCPPEITFNSGASVLRKVIVYAKPAQKRLDLLLGCSKKSIYFVRWN